MKRYFFLPRFKMVSLAFMFLVGIIITSEMGCAQKKPGCGSKRDHRVRKKKVKKFAPSMSYHIVQPSGKGKYFTV